jgi:hypothetical protein
MPPGAKKSWRLGRFSGEVGVIEMGAVMDNVEIACGSWRTEAVQFL